MNNKGSVYNLVQVLESPNIHSEIYRDMTVTDWRSFHHIFFLIEHGPISFEMLNGIGGGGDLKRFNIQQLTEKEFRFWREKK